MSKISDLSREAICYYLSGNSSEIGGFNGYGSRNAVEIDENKFFGRKHNSGRIGHEQRYIGGIERELERDLLYPSKFVMQKP